MKETDETSGLEVLTGSRLDASTLAWVHGLNTAHEAMLSVESAESLADLFRDASFCAVMRPDAGFVLCEDQDGDWPGANFQWMKARFDRFFYVDRIAVDTRYHGAGVGRALYAAAMDAGRAMGQENFVCEVNIDPPNDASLAFHRALGFEKIGQATHVDLGKTVVYLRKTLTVS